MVFLSKSTLENVFKWEPSNPLRFTRDTICKNDPDPAMETLEQSDLTDAIETLSETLEIRVLHDPIDCWLPEIDLEYWKAVWDPVKVS